MVSLEWSNLSVLVSSSKPKGNRMLQYLKKSKDVSGGAKELLRGVFGKVESGGHLLAIIGPCGAGRTTLLNALSNRLPESLSMSGQVLLNGSPKLDQVTSISGYVEESDILIGMLTVREQLWFQTAVRLGSWGKKKREQRIDEVVAQLGLNKCENTLIGIVGVLKGISGGERKRLSVGMELLDDPNLLFCDEPTVGLDSFMAENVVRILKDMAEHGKTILCTMRTMSSEVYSLFHHVMLMSEGRVVYQGSPMYALEYFAKIGYKCPSTYNPADYFLSLLTVATPDNESRYEKVMSICDVFENQAGEMTSEEKGFEVTKMPLPDVVMKEHKGPSSLWMQFCALLWRAWITNYRNVGVFRFRLLTVTLLSTMIGLCFFQINLEGTQQKDIITISGALNSLLFINWDNAFTMISSFYGERAVYMKEYGDGRYSSTMYYVTRVVAAIPHFFVLGTIWATVCFFLMGYHLTFTNFLTVYAIVLMALWSACSYGCMLAMLFGGDIRLIIQAGPMPVTLFWLTAGFYVNLATLPSWFSWLSYISWLRYTFETLMVSQWKMIGNLTCEYMDESMCIGTGVEVLDFYHMGDKWALWWNYVALFLVFMGFHFVATVALWVTSKRKAR